MPDVPSFALTLKESTREHHVRAERHPIQQAILQGRIDRATWGLLVAQNRAVHAALESALDAAKASDPRVGAVFAPHHRRLANYDADLAALGVSDADRAPLPGTRAVADWVVSLPAKAPISVLGVLYVIEGSTNGGQFLSRVLKPALRLESAAGVSSLDPHGPQTGPRWQQFRAAIDALSLSPGDQAAIIDVAGKTFDALGRVFDAVTEARRPAVARTS
ncbi:MAG: biliverdin-producing heme oxygenase [Phycisphaerales bacterium]